jgi:hypothetical protein
MPPERILQQTNSYITYWTSDNVDTMKNKFAYTVLFLSITLNIYSNGTTALRNSYNQKKIMDPFTDIKYFEASSFEIKGKYHKENNFYRLPSKYENIVRSVVWSLSKQSAGISVRFSTNSPIISAKWILISNSNMANMSKIGSCGLDLYCLTNSSWQYVNSGIPTGLKNESLLISNMDTTLKTFLINLPLYDGVESIQIGINKKFKISAPVQDIDKLKRPIVFYGTSITQGGSASRPGMAYPSIISRKLKVETINLGFSGNGRFEESVGQVLCDIEAALFVIDCTPNSAPDTIRKNALQLIMQIRKCKPDTPILLVESIFREYSFFIMTDENTFGGSLYIKAQNKELRISFIDAVQKGIKNLYYLEGNDLIGSDHEGTVDGTHLSDLGQYRLAEKVGAKIIEILKLK